MKNKKLFAILTLVCFMFTLMPVAAFAAEPVADTSAFVAVDGDQTIQLTDDVDFQFKANDKSGADATTSAAFLYVWATDANGVKTSALNVTSNATTESTAPQYAYGFKDVTSANTFEVSFARAGVYTVHAGFADAATTDMKNVTELNSGKTVSVITVIGTNANPATNYTMTLTGETGTTAAGSGLYNTAFTISNVIPNNVAYKYTLAFEDGGKDLTGKTVTIETGSANIVVNKETATTNVLGEVSFKLSASREGTYEVYVTIEGVTFTIDVTVGNNAATYIETTAQPKAALAQYSQFGQVTTDDFDDVTFAVTDINGNAVKNLGAATGANGIYNNAAKYFYFVEKPVATNLTNADLRLYNNNDGTYTLNLNNKVLDAEGTYTVKVILDNGAFATATWEVKKFGTPVQLILVTAPVVELGRTLQPDLYYVDANGTMKVASDVDLAATGYAIQSYNEAAGRVTIKTDEKYAGSTITLTAVSERYDLVATATVKVAEEATDVAFADTDLDVNVNNKVAWNVVDKDGNNVRLTNATTTNVKYVVLDKPEGAKVSVSNNDAKTATNFDGDGEMYLTSNMVGNVTVQIIVQVQMNEFNATTLVPTGNVQTKYYTGTKIFAVGTESVGDVVVMSIGSNSIIVNDAVATIDAAPVVENGRTFVPFRALAEAFGANVAYDEATQAVTAELNGVTVVMTIGSATYTVNGEEATMDVAPYIVDGRTMVPVRFAAEAFGIKVIPTYDENGATADILFNL